MILPYILMQKEILEIMFKVIICGSRDFQDYEKLKERCDYYLSEKIEKGEEIMIISGGARGADSLGERYAEEKGLPCKRYPANWDKYGKKAGYLRNLEMAEVANACIAFPCSNSENKGTEMMIRIAKEKHLLVRVVKDD